MSLLLCLLLSAACAHETPVVTVEVFANASNPDHDALHVELWRYDLDASGALLPLQKRDVYRADGQAPAHEALLELPPPGGRTYSISTDDAGENASFAVLAYTCRRDGADCRLNFSAAVVPLGWASDASTCVGAATGSEVCATPVRPTAAAAAAAAPSVAQARVWLSAPTRFGAGAASHPHGRIWTSGGGRRVLRVGGTPRQRGLAHGFLAAQQVVDVLRFFLLEDRALRGAGRGVAEYEAAVIGQLQAGRLFHTPAAVLEEAQGIVDGVRDAGVSLALPELGGRDATAWDVVALSAYGQLFVLQRGGGAAAARSTSSSCSQFVQTAPAGAGSGIYPIHARNMDGEVDVRKITVSHVLLIAVDRDPSDAASLRFVSVMWPGFIGTFSAMNEAGSSVMVNFGCPRPGADVASPSGNYSVDTQVVRDYVARASNLGPADAQALLHARHASKTGGVIVQGILVFARAANGNGSGFLYEGDSYGGAMRLPGNATVRPNVPGLVMATNHFHKYRVDERQARKLTDGAGDPTCNGAPVSFSSMWRYKSGLGYVYATSRAKQQQQQQQQQQQAPLGVDEMRGALRAVVEGYTEHSIVFQPSARRIAVAVASLERPMWEAPYTTEWDEFDFEYFFNASSSSEA